MSKEIEDFKLWCEQNNLKVNNYETLRLYLDSKTITYLSEELAQAFTDVRMKKYNSATFTYELLYAVEYIVAAVKEEASKTNGPGYPGYMLEKLNNAKRYLNAVIEYYNAHKNL